MFAITAATLGPAFALGKTAFALLIGLLMHLIFRRSELERSGQWMVGPEGDDGAALGLSASMTLINANGPITDPITAEGFYHVMQGRWRDGTPVTADDVIFGAWLSNNKNVGGSNETPTTGLLVSCLTNAM